MNNDSYKAWIDAMPVDDVRRRIERLERKLSDLHVLERLHADRHGAQGEEAPAGDGGCLCFSSDGGEHVRAASRRAAASRSPVGLADRTRGLRGAGRRRLRGG